VPPEEGEVEVGEVAVDELEGEHLVDERVREGLVQPVVLPSVELRKSWNDSSLQVNPIYIYIYTYIYYIYVCI